MKTEQSMTQTIISALLHHAKMHQDNAKRASGFSTESGYLLAYEKNIEIVRAIKSGQIKICITPNPPKESP